MPIKIAQVGNNLNIVFNQERFTINKNDVNLDFLYKVAFLYNQNSSNYLENKLNKIFDVFLKRKDSTKEENKKRRQERKILDNKLKQLTKNTSWNVKEGKILLGKNFYLPTEFVNYLQKARENGEDISAYKNFIEKLANNPVEHVRNNFFTYMQNCELKLTPTGNIIAYRYVKTLDGEEYNLEEVKEITQLYFKYKIQKKSPSKYEYKGKNLQECFDSLGNVFTDNYTKKQKYKIGDIISMPIEDADLSENTCSRGFHFTNYKGLDQLPYNFGKVLVLGIINPSKIVSIPLKDSYPKFRCIEWYFAGVIDKEFTEEFEKENISILDVDFNSKLEQIVNNNDPFNLGKKSKEMKDKIKELKTKIVKEKSPITIISSL